MRTTIDIPDLLFREVKARAAREGLKLKELLTTYIEAGLKGRIDDKRREKTQSRPLLPVAIPRDPTAPPVRALSNAELQALLDEDDIAEYRRATATPAKES